MLRRKISRALGSKRMEIVLVLGPFRHQAIRFYTVIATILSAGLNVRFGVRSFERRVLEVGGLFRKVGA